MAYLGDDISVSEDGEGRVFLQRSPPGVRVSLAMDSLVMMEFMAWVEDTMPEVLERVHKHTVKPLEPPVRATGKELRLWMEADGEPTRVSAHFYRTGAGDWAKAKGGVWWIVDETERMYGPCATLEEAAEAYTRNLDYLEKVEKEGVPRDPLTGDVRNARDLDKEPNMGMGKEPGGP
jgi:hypothetical protein